jgi:hypothetical protein
MQVYELNLCHTMLKKHALWHLTTQVGSPWSVEKLISDVARKVRRLNENYQKSMREETEASTNGSKNQKTKRKSMQKTLKVIHEIIVMLNHKYYL